MATPGRVRYVPDHKGIAALALGGEMAAAMLHIANDGARIARGLALADAYDTGEYADSFTVRPAIVTAGWKNEPRRGAVIENTAPHAAAVEWKNNDRILGRTRDILDSSRRGKKPAAGRRSKPSGAST